MRPFVSTARWKLRKLERVEVLRKRGKLCGRQLDVESQGMTSCVQIGKRFAERICENFHKVSWCGFGVRRSVVYRLDIVP